MVRQVATHSDSSRPIHGTESTAHSITAPPTEQLQPFAGRDRLYGLRTRNFSSNTMPELSIDSNASRSTTPIGLNGSPTWIPSSVSTHSLPPDDSLRLVSGTPTRSHWKPDSKAPKCASCSQWFTFLVRRHHCRRCGDVFCTSCCHHHVRLDQDAQYHPHGTLSRACDACYKDYTEYISIPQPTRQQQPGSPVTEPPAAPISFKDPPKELNDPPIMSVPSDWTWSTF